VSQSPYPPLYPGPPPHPPYPPYRRRTNGFAVASLILGILGVVILSVIFGCVALSQIRRRGDDGSGLAIAGLVLSGVWTALILIGVVANAIQR
jgi:hypothetical protein